jgi:hypothetical protein
MKRKEVRLSHDSVLWKCASIPVRIERCSDLNGNGDDKNFFEFAARFYDGLCPRQQFEMKLNHSERQLNDDVI